MDPRISLSKEEKNRVCVWLSVLADVNSCCAVCEEQKNKMPVLPKEEDWGYYYLHGRPSSYLSPIVIEDGLLFAAIIKVSSMFNTGNSGVGIASNNCLNVKLVRDELLKRTANNLGYFSADELEAYIKRLVSLRNQLLAHYDGSEADYSEELEDVYGINGELIERRPFIMRMKSSHIRFSNEEIAELKNITIKMHEALIDILMELDNQSADKREI